MNILSFIKNNIVLLDGAMGTMLHASGLDADVPSEKWNLLAPDIVAGIHKAYFDAGSNVISANTFGINALKYSDDEMEELISSAYYNCEKAKAESVSARDKFIAFDIGPLGKLLSPFGELDFNEAVRIFSKAVCIAVKYPFDLVLIETMNDSYETKAALLAVKENSALPVFVTNAYGEDGKLVTGATPEVMAALLESMGADAIGVNCSFGPDKTMPVINKLLNATKLPLIMKPNAGLPEFSDGKTIYTLSAEEFAAVMSDAADKGISIIGGCCGTTPEFIKETAKALQGKSLCKRIIKKKTVVSSYTGTVEFNESPVLIGERINPTGKKRFKQALIENDIEYILNEGIAQQKKGVHLLDVNVGLAGIDEAEMLERIVFELQTVCDLPLQLDSADTTALERAMRIYNGKPLINSVNGKKESMESVFPLIKKYGGCVVALTLDENGIPETASGRIEIAEKILRIANEYGIEKEDIIFDPLTMTISTNSKNADITLECIKLIKEKLGCNTILGVSNISFGLPARDKLNATFFSLALSSGLSGAIMNPFSEAMTDTYYAYKALKGLDDNYNGYISYCSEFSDEAEKTVNVLSVEEELVEAICKGRKILAEQLTRKLLTRYEPLYIVNKYIIPALDKTGESFEKGKTFLPQLLVSADAASAAFDCIKKSSEKETADKCRIILATVEGDIHDIGKNIVKLLLENYGFDVIDLGKNVKAEAILEKIIELDAPIVGLSALMTTTLPSMKKTVELIKKEKPDCCVFVGGAVVTQEFASSINADKYTKDAMESVRYAEAVYEKL